LKNLIDAVLERIKEEEGQFFLAGIISAFFAAWLVMSGGVELIFWLYSLLIALTLMIRFMTKSRYLECFPLYAENVMMDVLIGIGAGLLWILTIYKTPFGALPIPYLPESIAASTIGFLAVIILGPMEEYPFRGAIQATLGEFFHPLIALPIQAAAFMIFLWAVSLHGELSTKLIASFIFGLYVGIIALWRKGILAGMITHFMVNFAVVSSRFFIV
jgi:membrane protease YdiL (CAAX protease family)